PGDLGAQVEDGRSPVLQTEHLAEEREGLVDHRSVPGGRDDQRDPEGLQLFGGFLPDGVARQDHHIGLEPGDRLVVQLVQALGDEPVLGEVEVGQAVQRGPVHADDAVTGPDGPEELVGVAVQHDGRAGGAGQEHLAILVVDDPELLGLLGPALDGDLAAGGESEGGQGGECGAERGAGARGSGRGGGGGDRGCRGVGGGDGARVQATSGGEGSPRLSISRFAQAKKAAAQSRSASSGSVSPRARNGATGTADGRGRESSAAAVTIAAQRPSWPSQSGESSAAIQSRSRSSGAASNASTSSSRSARAAALRAWPDAQ